MACASCSTGSSGKPGGCNGNCGGGCNKMNTHDWLASYDIYDAFAFDVVEVSFKNGARKDFFINHPSNQVFTGDAVLVEVAGGGGYDIGTVSLSGELVRMQIKKKGLRDDALFLNIIRKTNERDVERLSDYRAAEMAMLVQARAIARSIGLEMKIGEVEMQGDGRKATFLYTADGRVDFRELIRLYNKEFKVKIEMRQIGARQEAARIGGVGSCGRELCCSTWLSDFKSISTAAARYQQLAINQVKLSGMCGRLKCCLNYELDSYLDAMESFPPNPDRIFTLAGKCELIKTDVFRALMTYYVTDGTDKGKFFTVAVADVKRALDMNKQNIKPASLKELQFVPLLQKMYDKDGVEEEPDAEYDAEELVGSIELPDEKKRNKKKKKPLGFNAAPNANANNPNRSNDNRANANNPNRNPNNPNRNQIAPQNRNNFNAPRDNQPPRSESTDEPINPALIDNVAPPRKPNPNQNPNFNRTNNNPPKNKPASRADNIDEPINPALIDNGLPRRPNFNADKVSDSTENTTDGATPNATDDAPKKHFKKKPYFKNKKPTDNG